MYAFALLFTVLNLHMENILILIYPYLVSIQYELINSIGNIMAERIGNSPHYNFLRKQLLRKGE